MSIDVCIGNYGYYNEGELRDAWISLPKTSEEISDFLSAHGLQDPEHEEIYISDYDGVPFGLTGLFSEFTWLEDLNMLARQMEEREGAVEKVQGALDCGIDGPESVIGLMNWIEQADEIPYYAYDYTGAYAMKIENMEKAVKDRWKSNSHRTSCARRSPAAPEAGMSGQRRRRGHRRASAHPIGGTESDKHGTR